MFFTYSKDLSFRANFPSRKFEHRKRLLWNTHSANLEPRQIESGVSWLCFGAIKTSYVTFIFSLIAVHLKKKTILINDSTCRGHFWLYAHVHLDNKILSLVIHAGMKVSACALQIFFYIFSAMVAAFITLLNHHGKPFTVYINYLRLSVNKLIN